MESHHITILTLLYLDQRIRTELENHQHEIMNFQNQIDDLRSENNATMQIRLRQLSFKYFGPEDLNLTDNSSESDVDEIDNLTFGRFEDFLARVDEADLTSSDRSGIPANDSSDEEVDNLTFGSHSAFLTRIKKPS